MRVGVWALVGIAIVALGCVLAPPWPWRRGRRAVGAGPSLRTHLAIRLLCLGVAIGCLVPAGRLVAPGDQAEVLAAAKEAARQLEARTAPGAKQNPSRAEVCTVTAGVRAHGHVHATYRGANEGGMSSPFGIDKYEVTNRWHWHRACLSVWVESGERTADRISTSAVEGRCKLEPW